MAGMGDGVGELAVVGEQQQALGLRVQPTDRMKAVQRRVILAHPILEDWKDHVHHGGGGVGVVTGGDAAGGLVEYEVKARNLPRDAAPFHRNMIPLPVHLVALVADDFAINGDFPLRNELFRFAPGGDAGGGKHLL